MSSPELDFGNATSSLASEDGLSRSASPESPTTMSGGQEAAPASPSLPLETRWVSLIRAIYSRRGAALSRAAALQESLESRLQAGWDVNGSLEFVLKWRRWDMPHGGPICALRASERPTSGSGCSGWPKPWATPSASDFRHPGSLEHMAKRFAHTRGKRLEQQVAAYLPSGRNIKRFNASTEITDVSLLNPGFTLWLQGYPETWLSSGARATRSIRGSQPNSFDTHSQTKA